MKDMGAMAATESKSARGVLPEVVGATLLGSLMVWLSARQGGWWERLSPAAWIYLPLLLLFLRRCPLNLDSKHHEAPTHPEAHYLKPCQPNRRNPGVLSH